MRTYSQFLEDLDSRRVALAQRKKQQMARIQQQNVQSRSSAAERAADAKSRLASDSDEMNAKEAEWKEKRKAAQDHEHVYDVDITASRGYVHKQKGTYRYLQL